MQRRGQQVAQGDARDAPDQAENRSRADDRRGDSAARRADRSQEADLALAMAQRHAEDRGDDERRLEEPDRADEEHRARDRAVGAAHVRARRHAQAGRAQRGRRPRHRRTAPGSATSSRSLPRCSTTEGVRTTSGASSASGSTTTPVIVRAEPYESVTRSPTLRLQPLEQRRRERDFAGMRGRASLDDTHEAGRKPGGAESGRIDGDELRPETAPAGAHLFHPQRHALDARAHRQQHTGTLRVGVAGGRLDEQVGAAHHLRPPLLGGRRQDVEDGPAAGDRGDRDDEQREEQQRASGMPRDLTQFHAQEGPHRPAAASTHRADRVSSTIAPSRRNRMRSAHAACDASCVTSTARRARARTARAAGAGRASPVSESSAPVGSSASTRRRGPTRARAIATRWCSPPDRSSGKRSPRSPISTPSSAAWASARAAAGGTPSSSSGSATFSAAVSAGQRD